MALMTYIALSAAVAVAFYILGFLKEYIRCRRLILALPGPKSYPLIGNLPDLLCDDATLFKRVRKWSRDHFPVYNLASGWILSANVSSPEDFELIASTTKNIEKSTVYKVFHLWLGEGLLTSTGSKWQSRRKILTPAFHFSILQQFVTVFNNETENLVKILKKECHKPEINVVPYISQFTLCSINETSMGTKLDLENKEDQNYFLAIHQIGKIFYQRIVRPWWYFSFPYYTLTSTGYKEKNLVKMLHDFTNTVIKKRAEDFENFKITDAEEFNYSRRKKMAMLDILLAARKTDDFIEDKGLQDEVSTFMFEGHDTTSMAICFLLMLLASHKDIQELILQEINQVLDKSNLQPTYNDLQELKYMERCIKEGLRIYPSVPFISRILEEDIVTSSGHTLPKGTVVNVHIFDIHRDTRIWHNPEKFDPDRFLPENCQDRHPFAYVPFSAGPRNCIGQRYAILEIKAVLCGILRNFEVEPVDTPDSIVIVPNMVLRPMNESIRVKFKPRT